MLLRLEDLRFLEDLRLEDLRLEDLRLEDLRLEDLRLGDLRFLEVRLEEVRETGTATGTTLASESNSLIIEFDIACSCFL